MEEEESVNEVLDLPPSSWLDQPTSCIKISIKTSTEKKKRWVMVIEDSLSGEQRQPSSDWTLFSEWAWIRNVAKVLKNLVLPSEYYPILLFHVGTNDSRLRSFRSIKTNFRAERLLKDSGAEVVFSFILPVIYKDTGRNQWTQTISVWLQTRCLSTFYFFFHPWQSLWDTNSAWAWRDPPVWIEKIFICPYASRMDWQSFKLGLLGKENTRNTLHRPRDGVVIRNIYTCPGSTKYLGTHEMHVYHWIWYEKQTGGTGNCSQNYNVIGTGKTWWNESHNWSA